MNNPLIATPLYEPKVCLNYHLSITKLKPLPDIFMPVGSMITVARNACVKRFLEGSWSHLFFIDGDVGFEPSAFRRLLDSGHDVTVAPCPFKHDDTSQQGGFVVDATELVEIATDGFAEIENGGTGFMCIAREVFEWMLQAGVGRNEFFDTMRKGEEYLAEDHAFCRRWRACGGKIYLDTTARISHQGTKVFERDFGKYLQCRSQPMPT